MLVHYCSGRRSLVHVHVSALYVYCVRVTVTARARSYATSRHVRVAVTSRQCCQCSEFSVLRMGCILVGSDGGVHEDVADSTCRATAAS